ncbi:MAG TPA: pyridoxal phosphate-dependent aminotransferase [Terriglobales bacterium]|nr:pyridoxal phosphate-dependent aminotransferase [Terriglobales bacterium]
MAVATQTAVKFAERINRIEVSATMAVAAEAEKLRATGADLVDFGAGEPHFNTPQHIKDAAVAAIQNNFTRYTAVAGIAELRDAIVKRHAADFGSDYRREEAIASTGGKHALFNLVQVLVESGDEVIIPVPYWVSFKDIVRYANGTPVFVESSEANGWAVTAAMVEQKVTSRTKLIILNSPNNPSGAVISPQDMTEIVRMAHRRGIYVISDECYVYLDYTGKRFSAGSITDAREHLLILGSLSKTYSMTGWRLGYALGPAAIVSATQKLQGQSTSNPTSVVQKAAVAALNGSQQPVEDMRLEYIQLRNRVVEGLRSIPGIHCNLPDGAFYAFPNVSAFFGKNGLNSPADVATRLLHEAKVALVPGEAFGSQENVRISYATSAGEIDRGIQRMREWFAAL